jgi:2,4-dienoyl-CoA reductase-like NADH-dependent reductase (Old Yellow Enzyme family)/NADPH-dependent 2,4-dienoyl-CoA reductase/sulfur reductase-like enzyme
MSINNRYPHVFTPIQIGGTLFRNRIFSAPTGIYNNVPLGAPSEDFIAYFERKAKGGAASVNIGEIFVDRYSGPKNRGMIAMSDQVTPRSGLGKMADGITRHGATAVMELNKRGMLGSPDETGFVYGPSDCLCEFNGCTCRAMTEEQILETVRAFADAAVYGKKLGYGMMMIHGGHGWLVHQFLSPTINKRTDRWGGTPENRARLAVMICDAIHERCGAGFPVEMRISGTEAHEGGYDLDEGIAIAKQLDGHADLIHVSVGGFHISSSTVSTHPNMFAEEGCNVRFAAEIKKHVKAPVAAIGALCTPEVLEEIIASGKADVVEMARGLICDPDLPNKAREGREKEIFRCMRCFNCVDKDQGIGFPFCALNPESGREWETNAALPLARKQKVLIAGGGIAGIQAAITASECGHEVILCEKTDRLGGPILCEIDVPFKKRLGEYIERQKYMLGLSGVDVRLNTEVTPEYAGSLQPDVLIAAIGSQSVQPPIPGLELPNVMSAEQAFLSPASVGPRAVILGAGFTGIELGLYLHSLGRHVDILEMRDTIVGTNAGHAGTLSGALREAAMSIDFNTKAVEVTGAGVRSQTPEGERFFEGETVINALGRKPLWDNAQELLPYAQRFYQIGDCRSPRDVASATGEAWTIARHIGRY